MELQNTIIVKLEPRSDLISLEELFPGGQSTSWSHSVLKIPRRPNFWQCSCCPKSKHQASTNTCSTCSLPALQPVRLCHCHKTESVGRSWESLQKPHYCALACQLPGRHCAGVPGGHSYPLVLLELSLHIHVSLLQQFFPNWLLQMVPWAEASSFSLTTSFCLAYAEFKLCCLLPALINSRLVLIFVLWVVWSEVLLLLQYLRLCFTKLETLLIWAFHC